MHSDEEQRYIKQKKLLHKQHKIQDISPNFMLPVSNTSYPGSPDFHTSVWIPSYLITFSILLKYNYSVGSVTDVERVGRDILPLREVALSCRADRVDRADRVEGVEGAGGGPDGVGGQKVLRGTDTQPTRSPSRARASSRMNFPSVIPTHTLYHCSLYMYAYQSMKTQTFYSLQKSRGWVSTNDMYM